MLENIICWSFCFLNSFNKSCLGLKIYANYYHLSAKLIQTLSTAQEVAGTYM